MSPRITAAFLSYLSYSRRQCNTEEEGGRRRGTGYWDTKDGTRIPSNTVSSISALPRRCLDAQRESAIATSEKKSLLMHRTVVGVAPARKLAVYLGNSRQHARKGSTSGAELRRKSLCSSCEKTVDFSVTFDKYSYIIGIFPYFGTFGKISS